MPFIAVIRAANGRRRFVHHLWKYGRVGVWFGIWLGLFQGVVLNSGMLWKAETTSRRGQWDWHIHAIHRDIQAIREAKGPVCAVIGSSIVGSLDGAAFDVPGWTTVIVTAANANASDLDLLTRWSIEAGADAVVWGTSWAHLAAEDEGGRTLHVSYQASHGPALWAYRGNIAAFFALAWERPQPSYKELQTVRYFHRPEGDLGAIQTWLSSPGTDISGMDFLSVAEGTSREWGHYQQWAARPWSVPRGVVLMPHNPAFEKLHIVPAGIGPATASWLRGLGGGIPVLDLSTSEQASRFFDSTHQWGLALSTSRAIGRWITTDVVTQPTTPWAQRVVNQHLIAGTSFFRSMFQPRVTNAAYMPPPQQRRAVDVVHLDSADSVQSM